MKWPKAKRVPPAFPAPFVHSDPISFHFAEAHLLKGRVRYPRSPCCLFCGFLICVVGPVCGLLLTVGNQMPFLSFWIREPRRARFQFATSDPGNAFGNTLGPGVKHGVGMRFILFAGFHPFETR